jgi:hypothetical protein
MLFPLGSQTERKAFMILKLQKRMILIQCSLMKMVGIRLILLLIFKMRLL